MTRLFQGLSSLAPGVKMRDPGNEVAYLSLWYKGLINTPRYAGFFCLTREKQRVLSFHGRCTLAIYEKHPGT